MSQTFFSLTKKKILSTFVSPNKFIWKIYLMVNLMIQIIHHKHREVICVLILGRKGYRFYNSTVLEGPCLDFQEHTTYQME
jgi:hypothetical protein